MHATKLLSTKSPIVWQANLRPSRIHAALYGACLCLALVALLQCPLPWQAISTLIIVTLAGGIAVFPAIRRHQSLAWCEDASWLFDDGTTGYQGQTAAGSYRSTLLIVVAVKTANSRKHYAVIWRDAVPTHVFSALHIQLATTASHQLQ